MIPVKVLAVYLYRVRNFAGVMRVQADTKRLASSNRRTRSDGSSLEAREIVGVCAVAVRYRC